jgi:hypothetical protein
MPLDPEDKPREFLIILLSVGLKVFANKPWSDDQICENAERFVSLLEQKYGKLNRP